MIWTLTLYFFQGKSPDDDNGEAELFQWFQDNVKSIRPTNARKYVAALVDDEIGIDSVVRLLEAANNPMDKNIESIISNKRDFVDFKAVVASMIKETSPFQDVEVCYCSVRLTQTCLSTRVETQ